jgi:hypothetical protein
MPLIIKSDFYIFKFIISLKVSSNILLKGPYLKKLRAY